MTPPAPKGDGLHETNPLDAKDKRPRFLTALAQHRVALLSLPLALWFINNNWLFNAPNMIDPWVYYGFFTHLHSFKLLLFPGTYYGSRLPYVLPGYLLNQLFQPNAANYVLHLGMFYAVLVSLYFIIRRLASPRAALIACIFCGSSHYYLAAIGWDYVDSGGLTYYLASAAFITKALDKTPRRFVWLLLGGAAYAGMLYCNLFWIIFSPFFFGYVLFAADGLADFKGHCRNLSFFLGGIALVTLFLCALNSGIDGTFWFYRPTIVFVKQMMGVPNPWKAHSLDWLHYAGWLLAPLAALAGAGGYLVWNARRLKERPIVALFAANYVFSFLILAIFELKGTPTFEFYFKTSHLLPPLFLIAGVAFCGGSEKLSRPAFAALAVGFAALMTLPLWGVIVKTIAPEKTAALLLASAAAATAGFLAKVVKRDGSMALAALLACVCLMQEIGSIGSDWLSVPRGSRQADFEATIHGMAVLDSLAPGVPLRFWYNATKDPNGGVFTALNSIYLWGYTWISTDFPSLKTPPSTSGVPVRAGDTVAVLSTERGAYRSARAALQANGYRAQQLAEVGVGNGPGRYFITLLRTLPAAASITPVEVAFADGAGPGQLSVASGETSGAPFPMNHWRSADPPHADLKTTREGLRVRTPNDRWGYAAIYDAINAVEDGEYVFEIKYRVLSGQIAFGALSSDRARWIAQAPFESGPEEHDQSFSVTLKTGDTLWLLLTNNNPSGKSSDFIIEEVMAYRNITPAPGRGSEPPRE